MIVNVLQEDIDTLCTSPDNCPIARALTREFPDFKFGVTQVYISIHPPKDHPNGHEIPWRIETEVNRDWINQHDIWAWWKRIKDTNPKWDQQEPPKPEPFQFELEIPWQTWNRNRLVQVLAFAQTMDHEGYNIGWDRCIFGQYAQNNKLGLLFDEQYVIPRYQDKDQLDAIALFLGLERTLAVGCLAGCADFNGVSVVSSLQGHIDRIEKYLAENPA